MEFTTQTKIDNIHTQFLEESCRYIGQLRGRLLSSLLANKELTELKKTYIAEYGLTARQFNSLASEVKGMIGSVEELRKNHIQENKGRIASLKKNIKSLIKKLKNTSPACGIKGEKSPRRKLRFSLHQKKRRLTNLEAKLKNTQNKLSICLGTKKLFLVQYHLEENGYKSHQEWLEEFQRKRTNRLFMIGSSDESFGNQNCQWIGNRLYIRVIPKLSSKFGDTYIIDNISFPYHEDELLKVRKHGLSLSYRFVRKSKGWYLFVTAQTTGAQVVTNESLGTIGVDLNPSLLAISETDRHGNPVHFDSIHTPLQDRRTHQVKATLSEAVNNLVEYAKEKQKPIVIEKLDFQKKKNSLKEKGLPYRRMLSFFTYSLFFLLLTARALRKGVAVIIVNPAFTSLIGKYKFMSLYGLSVHLAASLVIARRGLGFSERLPANYALCLAEHKHRHVWSFWKALHKAVSNREIQVEAKSSRRSGGNSLG